MERTIVTGNRIAPKAFVATRNAQDRVNRASQPTKEAGTMAPVETSASALILIMNASTEHAVEAAFVNPKMGCRARTREPAFLGIVSTAFVVHRHAAGPAKLARRRRKALESMAFVDLQVPGQTLTTPVPPIATALVHV